MSRTFRRYFVVILLPFMFISHLHYLHLHHHNLLLSLNIDQVLSLKLFFCESHIFALFKFLCFDFINVIRNRLSSSLMPDLVNFSPNFFFLLITCIAKFLGQQTNPSRLSSYRVCCVIVIRKVFDVIIVVFINILTEVFINKRSNSPITRK